MPILYIETFTFTGNGDYQEKATAFEPEMLVLAPAAAQVPSIFSPTQWCGRTNAPGPILSQSNAIRFTQVGFGVGSGGFDTNNSNSKANDNGTTYHGLALAGYSEGTFEASSMFGNGVIGRQIDFDLTAAAPLLTIVKRDTAREALGRFWGNPAGADTTALAAGNLYNTVKHDIAHYLLTVGAGFMTVDGGLNYGPYVNQFEGNQFGEACEYYNFLAADNVRVVFWDGNSTASTVLGTVPGYNLKAAFVLQLDGARAMRIKTDTMAGSLACITSASGPQANDLSISGGSLLSGTAVACNETGKKYAAILIGDPGVMPAARTKKVPAMAKNSARPYVSLPGRDATETTGVISGVDCGAGDLGFAGGAHTQIWMGAAEYGARADNQRPFYWLAGRGSGPLATAGNVSWGIGIGDYDDGNTQGLSGPMFVPSVTDRMLTATADVNPPTNVGLLYRTGILVPAGFRDFWVAHVTEGNGKSKMYLNGRLVKQRDIDMANNPYISPAQPNLISGAGHRITIGCRHVSGTTFADSLRARFAMSRVYTRALSPAEIRAQHKRFALGDTSVADVTNGLASYHDARFITGGNTLVDQINAANNGTIMNGTVLTA